ncbi:MAG: hypothetical protein JJ975_04710 [Bacteroidia bacterium]|nr:hypothetical protein [Bacteroidia bacterium]
MKLLSNTLRPYLKGLPLIILLGVTALMIARKYLVYTTPKFESTAKLKLAERSEGVPNNDLFEDFDVFVSTNNLEAEIELIKSDVLIKRVIRHLDLDVQIFRVGTVRKQELYRNSPIRVQLSDSFQHHDLPFSILIQNRNTYHISCPSLQLDTSLAFGQLLDIGGSGLRVSVDNDNSGYDVIGRYEFYCHSNGSLIQTIQNNLDVYPAAKEIPVISIRYRSTVPKKSADIANGLAQAYIDDYVETRRQAAQSAVDFLDEQIQTVSKGLSKSENRIESYKSSKRIVNLRQESETDLRKIAQLKIQLSNLKISLEAIDRLESQLRYNRDSFLKSAPNFQAHTDLLSTELLKKVKQYQAEKRDLLITYTAGHEKVRVVDSKIQDIADYLMEAVSNTKENLSTKYYELNNEINQAELAFNGFSQKEKNLAIMNRKFSLYENSYNFLNEKRLEAEIAKAANISLHRIISWAKPSRSAVSPNTTIIQAVSCLLGLFIGVVLIYLLHSLRRKASDEDSIETRSAIPILFKTPYLKKEDETQSLFHRYAVQLELKGLVKEGGRLVFTSFGHEDGVRFHIRELSKTYSEQGKKVLVINCCEHKISQNAHSDVVDIDLNNQKKSSKSKFKKRVKKLSRNYDVVLINNSGQMQTPQGLLALSIAHCNLFLVDSQNTPVSDIDTLELIQHEYNFPGLHFIINRFGHNPSVLQFARKFLFKQYQQIKNTTDGPNS